MKKIKVCFSLSKPVVDELNFLAEELNENKNTLIEKALDYYFACIDEKMALESAKKVENGIEKLENLEDVLEETQEENV